MNYPLTEQEHFHLEKCMNGFYFPEHLKNPDAENLKDSVNNIVKRKEEDKVKIPIVHHAIKLS